MNKITKIFAAALMTGASAVSVAGTEFETLSGVSRVGDNYQQGHRPFRVFFIPGLSDAPIGSSVVIQFNVRSTNKSQYNAVYLRFGNKSDLESEFCDPVQNNSGEHVPGEPILVTFLPFSPHQEVHNDEVWSNGWRSVHAIVHLPEPSDGYLQVCSRDEDGDVVGDLDDFEISDIVVQFLTE